MEPDIVRKRPKGKPHIYNSFPHYSAAEPNHCICLDECCQSDYYGCVCMSCPCRVGIFHEPYLRQEIALLEKIRQEKEKENAAH